MAILSYRNDQSKSLSAFCCLFMFYDNLQDGILFIYTVM